ncbi:MAG: fructose-1,6-bisphosphatase, fructose-1,6-bisphosphatase I [Candidatus Peregrinibacteria bacterium GW2011_GWF2_33_10]|nr:MAG: fructose-1,6-bisphosphatase, fructose-1,6-bisphosphatase I [Candidatus Peregrinibacteria bacterium GW2011_GWF2_33_10]OGJ45780.1 MAG: hypothetical protein A2263_01255 [Candidatus Peregrinibacteria bacterium RIFOXYA2_FULL_33_21]OGJ46840.1 MAG: hypothetical protein A2272_00855 [Candidatus Peregrinibacteria bacterium RIFOXYA12_FULL_33_12]OGJ51326.1 MAG: hypothetical protein A2307_00530 [Candidatus Peregrinibacteria bacterium RIFOXYB2_FULL_33_20]
MATLVQYLKSQDVESSLMEIFLAFEKAVKEIAKAINFSDGGYAGSQNASGEEQLALDILSDQILEKAFKKTEKVYLVASEEKEEAIILNENGQYSVAYDPLDGSSLVNVNFAVGTILGVFKFKEFLGKTPKEMSAAAFAVYGPRTTIVLSIGNGTHEFTLRHSEFVMTRENLKIKENTKIFAPGNLKAAITENWYRNILKYWLDSAYKLRYSGGMVPDINHILVKGEGIFAYPGTKKEPDGKLRLLFECGPMAYLIENARGAACDGKISILDKQISSIHQRTPIFIGSKAEVERCKM